MFFVVQLFYHEQGNATDFSWFDRQFKGFSMNIQWIGQCVIDKVQVPCQVHRLEWMNYCSWINTGPSSVSPLFCLFDHWENAIKVLFLENPI